MNLIMYELNIYVNNSKFISIVDNVGILQLPPSPWALFIPPKICPGFARSLIVSRQCRNLQCKAGIKLCIKD